jgi:hypothetical protein
MHLLKGNVSLVTHPKPVEPKADQHMSFPSSVRPMAEGSKLALSVFEKFHSHNQTRVVN